jgi:hypothetical protein
MSSSNGSKTPASRSIRAFLHLQTGRGSAPASSRPPASVNRLTDQFLRAVGGPGSSHLADSASGITGDLDEDIIAKMLSDGARSHGAQSQKNSLAAADFHSSPRVRKVHSALDPGGSPSPRTSDRRSRALASAMALVAESAPVATSAVSLDLTHLRMQQQRSKPDTMQPPLQRKQVSPAAHPSPDSLPVSSQSQGHSQPASQTSDTGSRSAGPDVPAHSALAVLGGLTDIREMKADSLLRSHERESVTPIIIFDGTYPKSHLSCAGAHQPSRRH